jgi:histidine triad (HIT) family protein
MTLHAAYDDKNIFAKMLRYELPFVRVFEDDVALAFMDIFPQTEGHTLVIPKGYTARNFLEMPPEALGAYMKRVQLVAKAVEAGLKPDGLAISQFNGVAAGQTVFHLHFHILPRWQDERLGAHASGGKADTKELEAIAARIKAAL